MAMEELQESQNIPSKTKVIYLYCDKASPILAKATGWQEESSIWTLIRKRMVDGKAVILDKDYLLRDIIDILPIERAEDSIYDYFENDLNLQIGYAHKEITVEPVTEEDKQLLDIGSDSHIVVVRSVVSLEDTRCFEYTESRHRLDTFKFIDFARRRKA